MHLFIAENAKPNPKSTINSYRSFGYNLSTVIADFIDNSISAYASVVAIDYLWKGLATKSGGDDWGGRNRLPRYTAFRSQ